VKAIVAMARIMSAVVQVMQDIRDGIAANVRFNALVETGIAGFVPRAG
jgi:hypothetical protein